MLSNLFPESDDTLDKTNQSLRSFELVRIKIRMLISILSLIYKYFSSQVSRKSTIQPNLDLQWVDLALQRGLMTLQMGRMTVRHHFNLSGLTLKLPVLISLPISRYVSSQIPQKSTIKPKLGPIWVQLINFLYPMALQTGILFHKRLLDYILTEFSGLLDDLMAVCY